MISGRLRNFLRNWRKFKIFKKMYIFTVVTGPGSFLNADVSLIFYLVLLPSSDLLNAKMENHNPGHNLVQTSRDSS